MLCCYNLLARETSGPGKMLIFWRDSLTLFQAPIAYAVFETEQFCWFCLSCPHPRRPSWHMAYTIIVYKVLCVYRNHCEFCQLLLLLVGGYVSRVSTSRGKCVCAVLCLYPNERTTMYVPHAPWRERDGLLQQHPTTVRESARDIYLKEKLQSVMIFF